MLKKLGIKKIVPASGKTSTMRQNTNMSRFTERTVGGVSTISNAGGLRFENAPLRERPLKSGNVAAATTVIKDTKPADPNFNPFKTQTTKPMYGSISPEKKREDKG